MMYFSDKSYHKKKYRLSRQGHITLQLGRCKSVQTDLILSHKPNQTGKLTFTRLVQSESIAFEWNETEAHE